MTRRSSAMPRSDQEFAVSVAAGNRRFLRTDDAPALSRDKTLDVGANSLPHRLVADDAFLQMRPSCLDVRLDQHDEFRRRRAECERRGQHELQRDKAHIGDHKLDRLGYELAVERARIGALKRHDAAAVLQRRMKLAVADIDGIDEPGAALEENLAEAAGGSADIEADLAPG